MPRHHVVNKHQNSHTHPTPIFSSQDNHHRHHASSGNGDDDDDATEQQHPMSKTSFLSHVMLKVPSVDQTAKYWTDKGGRIRMSRYKQDVTNGDSNGSSSNTTTTDTLLSAFVELGCSKTASNKKKDNDESSPVCFALELVAISSNTKKYSIGNAISYVGVSMLLQFQNNLLGLVSGESKIEPPGTEPNGIPVQSAASAPGDFLARLALHSNNLKATHEFYTSTLGMEAKAQDDNMLCLRYDNDCFQGGGVPTTLVFDALPSGEEVEVGDCFDHVVVATSVPVDDLYQRFQKENQGSPAPTIFMKPTNMFGKQVMGLIDPNGYKVIIASSSST